MRIIILEGVVGTGKTTIANHLREHVPYSNLYRLGGHGVSSYDGWIHTKTMYDALETYLNSMKSVPMTLIFDRTFISEEIYCARGYRKYKTDFEKYVRSLDRLAEECTTHIIHLDASVDIALQRMQDRGDKAGHLEIIFKQEYENIKNEYYRVINNVNNITSNVYVSTVNTDGSQESVLEEIYKIIADDVL